MLFYEHTPVLLTQIYPLMLINFLIIITIIHTFVKHHMAVASEVLLHE